MRICCCYFRQRHGSPPNKSSRRSADCWFQVRCKDTHPKEILRLHILNGILTEREFLSSEVVGCAAPPCNSFSTMEQMQSEKVTEDKLAGMVRSLKRRIASLNDMRQAWGAKVGAFKMDERHLLRDLSDRSFTAYYVC